MRKVTAIFLTFIMVLGLYVPVSASNTIKIEGPDYSVCEPQNLAIDNELGRVQLWGMHSVGYKVDFKYPTTEVTLEYQTGPGYRGIVEVHLDSRFGETIGIMDSTDISGDWTLSEWTIPLTKQIVGEHTIWLYNQSGMHWIQSVSFDLVDPDAPVRKFADASERYAFSDIEEDANAVEISLMADLGIVSTENGLFMPEKPLRRIDFVHMLGSAINAEKYSSSEEIFSDVDQESEDGILLSGLYNLGIIKGYDDGTFKPNNIIKLNEAASVCVNALGYGLIKNKNTDAFEIINSLKLFKGIDTKDDYLDKSDGAKLIYNILISDYLVGKEIVKDFVVYEPEKNFLEKNSSYVFKKGRVTGSLDTDLYAPIKNRNNVTIDGEIFALGETNATSFLGMYCEYFYTEDDGGKKLVSIRPSKSVEITEVETSNGFVFDKITEQEILFRDDDDEYEYTFDLKTAFIYNGVALDVPLSTLIEAKNFVGKITLIDNDKDGVCDCVWIDHAKSIVISGLRDSFINDKLTNDYLDTTDATVDIYNKGRIVKFKTLAIGDVLTVYESVNKKGTKLIRAIVSQNVVTGVVSQVSNGKITIEGKEYTLYSDFKEEIFPGLSADFYINECNQIVKYEKESSNSKNVGVILNTMLNENGIDEKLELKILTKEGIKYFETAEDVIADGEKIKNVMELYSGTSLFKGFQRINKNTLVLYSTDSNGKIKMIDTESPGAGGINDTLTKLSEPFTTYGTHNVLLDISTWRTAQPFTSDATFVMLTNDNDERNYSIGTGFTYLSETETIKVTPYSSKSESFLADIIYTNEYGVSETESWQMPFVFKGVGEKINSDGDKTLVIKGTSSLKSVEYEVNMEKYDVDYELKTIIGAAKPGDIVWPKIINSKLIKLELTYIPEGTDRGGIFPTMTSPSYQSPFNKGGPYLFLATVEKIEDGFVKLKCDYDVAAGSDEYRYNNMSMANVATIERLNNGQYKVFAGKPSSSVFEGDRVLVYSANWTIEGMYIYRGIVQ